MHDSRHFREGRRIAACMAAAALLSGCGARAEARAVDDPLGREAARAGTLRATPDLVLSTELGGIADLEVDSAGTMYVADALAQQVMVFDAAGSRIATIGRRGSGPGEFRGLRDLAIRGDSLYALDAQAQRVAVYRLGGVPGAPAYTVPVGYPGEWANYEVLAPARGGLLIQYSVPATTPDREANARVTVRRLDGRRGVVPEPVLAFRGSTFLALQHPSFGLVVGAMPYGRTGAVRLAGDRLIVTRSDSLRVETYDAAGRRLGGFGRERPAVAVSAADVRALIHSYGDDRMGRMERKTMELAVREDLLPRRMPAFGALVVDDQARIWVEPLRAGDRMVSTASGLRYVRTPSPDGTVPWWILDLHGSVVGAAWLPARLSPRVIRGGYVYGTEADQDGVERVARYRLSGPRTD